MNEDDRVQQQQRMARVKKNAWSRERCEELFAIANMQDDFESAEIVAEAAQFLLEVRQAFRGGRLNVRGSARHWNDEAERKLG